MPGVDEFGPDPDSYPAYTPNPTFTPYPTFTPIPSPPPAKVLFEEGDFSGVENCFPVESAPDVRRFAEDGQCHIVVQKKIYLGWAICENGLRHFKLDVDITPIEGPGNNSNVYGVVFRVPDLCGRVLHLQRHISR